MASSSSGNARMESMASSSSSNAGMERNRNTFESESEPKEIEMQYEKITLTDLDDLGVALKTQPDGSLKITSSPQEARQIDQWNRKNPNKKIKVGDVITCVNGIGMDDSDLMRKRLDSDNKLNLTVRTSNDNATKLRPSKLNEIDANYKRNHSRKPDSNADIRVIFPDGEEYVGKYLSHGQSKTVFIITRSGHEKGRYDGCILKMRLRTRDCKKDREPDILKVPEAVEGNIVPKLYWEGIGVDGEAEYHCWVVERCIPLNQLAKLPTCDKDTCVLAACRVIARAALCKIQLSDCHYYNLGLRIASEVGEHEVVIIDAGSRGLADRVPLKDDLKKTMYKLWDWSKEEIQASPDSTLERWATSTNGTTLADFTNYLDRVWQGHPYLTSNSEVPTAVLDRENIHNAKCTTAKWTGRTTCQMLILH